MQQSPDFRELLNAWPAAEVRDMSMSIHQSIMLCTSRGCLPPLSGRSCARLTFAFHKRHLCTKPSLHGAITYILLMQAASGQALPACLLAAASLLTVGTATPITPELRLGLLNLAQQLLSSYASTLSQALNLSNRALCNAALAVLASVAGLGPLQSQAVLTAIQWDAEALRQMTQAPRFDPLTTASHPVAPATAVCIPLKALLNAAPR